MRLHLLLGINVFWLAASMLTDGINSLILPSLLLPATTTNASATALGLITFVGLLAAALVQPVAGLWSDNLRRQWGRQGILSAGVLLTLLGLAFLAGAPSFWSIVIIYFFVQVSVSVAQAAQQGFLPDFIAREQRGLASGVKSLMDVGGALLGFVVVGQLLGAGRPQWALAAIAAVLLLTWGLTLVLVPKNRSLASQPPAQRLPWCAAFRFDWRSHRAFARLVVARFLFLWGTYAVGRFLLYFVAEQLNLTTEAAAAQAGNLLGGLLLVTVVATVPAGRAADRFGRVPLMVVGAALSALGVWLFPLATSSLTILLFGAFMALGSAAFAGANWALTADLAPPNEAARFLALANFGTAGAMAAAGLFGPVVDGVNGLRPGAGYVALFIAAGVAFVLSAVAALGLRTAAPATLGSPLPLEEGNRHVRSAEI